MSAFENTDAAFTACAPFLKFVEPTLLLSLLAGGARGVVVGIGTSQYGQMASLDASGDLARKLLSLPGNPAGDFQ